MNYIWWIIVFLISYEAIMWGWTLNRHAVWIKKHPAMDKRILVGPGMLRSASAMSTLFCIIMWFIYMYVTIKDLHYNRNPEFWVMIRSLCIIGLQLSHIHFSAIIARYSCLPRNMWPIFSRLVSLFLVKFFGLREPPLTSYDVHVCWHSTAKKEFKKEQFQKEDQ